MLHRRPLGVQYQVSGGHGAARHIFAAVIAAGAGVPAAEGIGVLLQRGRIGWDTRLVAGGLPDIGVDASLKGHFVILGPAVIVQRQIVALPLVEQVGGIAQPPVVQRTVVLLQPPRVALACADEARQARPGLVRDRFVVIGGVHGAVQVVGHALEYRVSLLARRRLHIQLVDPLPGIAPADVRAVVEEGQEVHIIGILPVCEPRIRNKAVLIHQLLVQNGIIALDGGVGVRPVVLDVVLAVPPGEIGVVAPLPLAHVILGLVAGVGAGHLHLIEHLAGPQHRQVCAVPRIEFKVIELVFPLVVAALRQRAGGVRHACRRVDLRQCRHLAPLAAGDILQQGCHVVHHGAVLRRTPILAAPPVHAVILMAEPVGAAAHDVVFRIAAVLPLLRVEEPHGVHPPGVVDVDHSGAVALHQHILIRVAVHILPEALGIAIAAVGVAFIVLQMAQGGGGRQIVAAADRLAGDGAHALRAHIAVPVIVGVLQPVHLGVGRLRLRPDGDVAQILVGDGGGQRVRPAVALPVLLHQIPAAEHIAVAGRLVHQKRCAVPCVHRLRAVAAVDVELDEVIIPVVVALKHGGAVRRHRLGIVVQLVEAHGVGRVRRQHLIGDDGAGAGGALLVQRHVLRVKIVVDVLEIEPRRVGHVDGLVVHVHHIRGPVVVLRHRQHDAVRFVRRVHLALRRHGDVRLRRVVVRRVAQIGGGDHRIAVRRAPLDLGAEARIHGQPRPRIQIVDGYLDILAGMGAASGPAGRPFRVRRRLRQLRGPLLGLRRLVGRHLRLRHRYGVRRRDAYRVGDGRLPVRLGPAPHIGVPSAAERLPHQCVGHRQRRIVRAVDVHPARLGQDLPLHGGVLRGAYRLRCGVLRLTDGYLLHGAAILRHRYRQRRRFLRRRRHRQQLRRHHKAQQQ